MTGRDREEVQQRARSMRRTVIEMCRDGGGYAGQGIALADIVAALYFSVMRKNPEGDFTDRFVLSNGHDSIAVYAALHELGVFGIDELRTYRQDGSRVVQSPVEGDIGFEITAGSLGQGLSQAVGIALGERARGTDAQVYCLMSDGELQEGNVWEAVMAAAHFRLGNLVAIIDNNHLQADGVTDEIMSVEPVPEKFEAFGWHAVRLNGNDVDAVLGAFEDAMRVGDRPVALVCETELCAGVASLQKDYKTAHYFSAPQEVWERALAELT